MLKQAHIEPRSAQHRHDESELDGRHLRGENLVAFFAHFLGEDRALDDVPCGDLGPLFSGSFLRGVDEARVNGRRRLGALGNRRVEGAQTDFRSPQVGDLVDLQHRVDIAAALQDLLDLVGGDGIEAAAERIELDELEIRLVADSGGCLVEARVVGPLVAHAQGPFEASIGDRVLGEHSHSQADNDLRDPVVDLRVEVVGPPRKDDASHPVLAHPRD